MNIQEKQFAPIPPLIEDEVVRIVNEEQHTKSRHPDYFWIPAPANICLFAEQEFGKDVYVAIQLITGDLPFHIDYNAHLTHKYIYMIDLGGENVKTEFKDESVVLKLRTWYYMNVENYHRVVGVTGKRISLTVCVKK